jgi:hypothetical protein
MRMSAGGPFSQPQVDEGGRRWVPLAIGAAIIAAVVVAILVLGRPVKQAGPTAIAPYAENLRVGELKLSAAENFVGGSVSYLDGTIINVGNKTVTGVTVESVFRNSMGEIVQRESQPLMLYHTGMAGFPDVAPLSAAPLLPNQTRTFRLTFEHISEDWDHGYPELRFTRVITRD